MLDGVLAESNLFFCQNSFFIIVVDVWNHCTVSLGCFGLIFKKKNPIYRHFCLYLCIISQTWRGVTDLLLVLYDPVYHIFYTIVTCMSELLCPGRSKCCQLFSFFFFLQLHILCGAYYFSLLISCLTDVIFFIRNNNPIPKVWASMRRQSTFESCVEGKSGGREIMCTLEVPNLRPQH